MTTGTIYRLANADARTLRTLVESVVGLPCWTFGGAWLWDFEPARGENNLRPIVQVDAVERLDVSGDFGHVFSVKAEVRWRRTGRDSYDTLVLAEQEIGAEGLTRLGSFDVRDPQENAWIYLDTPNDVRSLGLRWRLGYHEYVGGDQGVRFVRYTERREEIHYELP